MFGGHARWLYSGFLALVLLRLNSFASGTEKQERTHSIQPEEVLAHRLTALPIIHQAMPFGFTEIQGWLHVVVDDEGRVESAKAWNLDRPDDQWARNQVEAAERQQQFRPFKRFDRPVRVRFDDGVWIVPPVEWAEHVAFPEILNRNSLRMAIQRTACYGMCPIYSMEIHGNGEVFFNGEQYVPAPGHLRGHVSPEVVDHLLASFRKANYLSLKDEYVSMITDQSTCITSIQFDSTRKSVKDYVGFAAGMPEIVWEVERDMDQIARKNGWIH